MHNIFINFRSGDQDLTAPLIERWLSEQFGEGVAFYSSKSIQAGASFPAELLDHARQCDVLLALIGPQWLTIAGADGVPLLSRPDDWVRTEIVTALAAGRKVVPVLIADAKRFAKGDLPAEIAALEELESVRLRRPEMDADLVHLREELVKLIPDLKSRSRRPAWGRPQVAVSVRDVGEKGKVTGARIPSDGALDADVTVEVGKLDGQGVGLDRYEPGAANALADPFA